MLKQCHKCFTELPQYTIIKSVHIYSIYGSLCPVHIAVTRSCAKQSLQSFLPSDFFKKYRIHIFLKPKMLTKTLMSAHVFKESYKMQSSKQHFGS